MSEANTLQHGGSHYLKHGKLQHWDVVFHFKLDYFQGQISKYLFRWRDKGGIEDLQKAKHFLEKYIELQLTDPNYQPSPIERRRLEFHGHKDTKGNTYTSNPKDVVVQDGHGFGHVEHNPDSGPNYAKADPDEEWHEIDHPPPHKQSSNPEQYLPSYPGNPRHPNGRLACGCWGVKCEGHEMTPIGEAS